MKRMLKRKRCFDTPKQTSTHAAFLKFSVDLDGNAFDLNSECIIAEIDKNHLHQNYLKPVFYLLSCYSEHFLYFSVPFFLINSSILKKIFFGIENFDIVRI